MTRISEWRWKLLVAPGIILLAAAVAVLPMLMRGPSCGGDFSFHFTAWHDALEGWRQGIAYPHWAASANFRAGDLRFVFYPPFSWMLGAALGRVLPWALVPAALSFLLLAATGLAVRALARQMLPDSISEGAATLAGCAAIFSGYALFDIYCRSDYSEASGGFWIPLLLLFLLRESHPFRREEQNAGSRRQAQGMIPTSLRFAQKDGSFTGSPWRRAVDGSTLPLALVLAGCWLSNAPLGVMASYLLAFVAMAVALTLRSWAPLLRAAVAAVLGIGLTSFYLLPAAWERRWVDIRHALGNSSYRIKNRWLFSGHFDFWMSPRHMVVNPTTLIGAYMIAAALGCLLLAWLLGKLPPASAPESRRWWVPLALIPPLVLFLGLPLSLPLWNLLPELEFLQFSYRWLVILQTPMAIFFALAFWPRQPRRRIFMATACAILFVAISVFAGRFFFIPFGKFHPETAASLSAMELALESGGTGAPGEPAFAPLGASNGLSAIGLPDACLVSDPFTVLGKMPDGPAYEGPKSLERFPLWQTGQRSCEAVFSGTSNSGNPEHLRFVATVDHPGFLILRLRNYPAWRVALNGRPVSNLPRRDDGLIAVPVAQGPVNLAVDWTTTTDVLAGRGLSALAALFLIGLWLLERKLSRSHLS
jgi:hypothetical protein